MVKKVLRIVRNVIMAVAMLAMASNSEIIAVIWALTKSFFELILFASSLSSSDATLFVDGDIFLRNNWNVQNFRGAKSLIITDKCNKYSLLVWILPSHGPENKEIRKHLKEIPRDTIQYNCVTPT